MKKIIVALDGLKYSDSIIDYAIYLAKEFEAYIVAAFLEEVSYHSQPVKHDMWWPYYSLTEKNKIDEISRKDEELKAAALHKMQQRFEAAGIRYAVHKEKYIALQSLLNESHFADMILVDADASFSNYDKSRPSHFLRNLLADAGCPVMLTPKKFKPVERFVFAYDGSPSSVFAIKQFSYIFPSISKQEIEIVMVNNDRSTSHLPHHKLLRELLKQRYQSVLQSVLRRNEAANALTEHLKTENRNCMLVMGAYDRSAFSMWLHHSTADDLIRKLHIPIFITHH